MQPAANDQTLLATLVKRNTVYLILMKVPDLITPVIRTSTASKAAQLMETLSELGIRDALCEPPRVSRQPLFHPMQRRILPLVCNLEGRSKVRMRSKSGAQQMLSVLNLYRRYNP